MLPVDRFFAAEIIVATMVFALLAIAEPFIEHRLHRYFDDNPPFQWGWDQFFAPLLRAVLILGFVYLAYPASFGLTVAPGLGELVIVEQSQFNKILGVLFVVGFAASLLPGVGTKPEYVLPLQGVIASAFVFHWLVSYLGITTADFWPGIDIVLWMFLVWLLTQRLARFLGPAAGHHLDGLLHMRGCDLVVVHVVELLAQIPVVLLYSLGLGRQLAI